MLLLNADRACEIYANGWCNSYDDVSIRRDRFNLSPVSYVSGFGGSSVVNLPFSFHSLPQLFIPPSTQLAKNTEHSPQLSSKVRPPAPLPPHPGQWIIRASAHFSTIAYIAAEWERARPPPTTSQWYNARHGGHVCGRPKKTSQKGKREKGKRRGLYNFSPY